MVRYNSALPCPCSRHPSGTMRLLRRKVSDVGCGLASYLAFLFVHFLGRNSFDRFLLSRARQLRYVDGAAPRLIFAKQLVTQSKWISRPTRSPSNLRLIDLQSSGTTDQRIGAPGHRRLRDIERGEKSLRPRTSLRRIRQRAQIGWGLVPSLISQDECCWATVWPTRPTIRPIRTRQHQGFRALIN